MVGRGRARVLDSFGLSAQCRCEFVLLAWPLGRASIFDTEALFVFCSYNALNMMATCPLDSAA